MEAPSQPPPSALPAHASQASPPNEPSPASSGRLGSDHSRRAQATFILNAVRSLEANAELRALVAAQGISEAGFGLPPDQLKMLGALMEVDRSQCSVLLKVGLLETARAAVEKRCGDLGALDRKLAALPAPERAEAVMKTCKAGSLDTKDAYGLNPWAILTSTIIADELAADPASVPEEKVLARSLEFLCSETPPQRSGSKNPGMN